MNIENGTSERGSPGRSVTVRKGGGDQNSENFSDINCEWSLGRALEVADGLCEAVAEEGGVDEGAEPLDLLHHDRRREEGGCHCDDEVRETVSLADNG